MSYGYPPPGGQGYPPQQQPGYPTAAGTYPASGGYPPNVAPGGYPQGAGGAYPTSNVPTNPYPPNGGYPSQGGIGFQQMQAPVPGQTYGYPGYAAPPGGPYQPAGGAPLPAGQYQTQTPYGAPGQGYPPAGMVPSQGYIPAQPYYGQAPPQHGQMAQQVTQGMAAMSIKTRGTVVPYAQFDAESDAQVLRKAMKGLGTDEKAIIGVIGYRSNEQRQKIKLSYKQAYGRDLVKDLKSELGGNFEDLVVAMFMKPREYDAYCLNQAMSGAGTTETALIEVLVSRSNEEINEIRTMYKRDYKKDLEKALGSETSGHFRKLLVSMNNGARDTSLVVDQAKAQADAQKLYSAGEKKWGTDEATFNLIMASRSFPQLRATFDAYHKIANRDIVKSIQGEFSGDVEDGMVAVVDVARYAPSYFAKRLHQSMKGAGTKDDALIRVVVSRSEVDMVEIKEQFLVMYKKTLPSFIKDDTSGDYKKLLLALVGN